MASNAGAARVAHKSGVCAMGGQTIANRDAVNRPRRVQPTPRNLEAMILAIRDGDDPTRGRRLSDVTEVGQES